MSHINIYKPRYFFRNRSRSKIYIYKDGYIRRFYERRGRRAKRGGLFRGYVLVANNRKWTIARRFIRPIRRSAGLRVKRSRSTIHGSPVKRFYKNSFLQKQRLRHFYGKRKEETFRSFFNTYRTLQGSSSSSFFSLLESRLDRILYRRRIFPTLYGCRQFINYHGVSVNQIPEYSTRQIIKVGDTISIPDFAWRPLYWDLFSRVYYRRWGRYIASQRFYSRFQKKVFKRRWYGFNNLSKNRRTVDFRKQKKSKNVFKKLWYNIGSPFSFSKYFQFFGKSRASTNFTSHSKEHLDTRRYLSSIQNLVGRRGSFIIRAYNKKSFSKNLKKVEFLTKRIANTNKRRAQRFHIRNKRKFQMFKAHNHLDLLKNIKQKKLRTYKNRLNGTFNEESRLESVNSSLKIFNLKRSKKKSKLVPFTNKVEKEFDFNKKRIKTSKKYNIFTSSYIQKIYYRLAKKKQKKIVKGFNIYNLNLFSQKLLPKFFNQVSNVANRTNIRIRGCRLYRRSFIARLQSFHNNNKFNLEKSHYSADSRYFHIFKETRQSKDKWRGPSQLQLLFDQRSSVSKLEEDNFHNRVNFRFDFYKQEYALLQRKRAKLSSYFFTQKIRKQVFPFFDVNQNNTGIKSDNNEEYVGNNLFSKVNLKAYSLVSKSLKARIYRRNFRYSIRLRLRTNRLKVNKNSQTNNRYLTINTAFSNKKNKNKTNIQNKAFNKDTQQKISAFNVIRKGKRNRNFSWKRKQVRSFRRKFARFFRRRRYRTRRRRRYPRLKAVHRYFPSYIQTDLRTLRSIKISNPTTNEIFSGFRLSAAKIYSYYKSRGFLI